MSQINTPIPEDLGRLIYELLDAHQDTTRLADGLVLDPTWDAHLAYLRDLQRVGLELLAAAADGEETGTFRLR